MVITLKPGEAVTIEFSETDGQVDVSFNEEAITVETDLPDDEGREGVIYQSTFAVEETK